MTKAFKTNSATSVTARLQARHSARFTRQRGMSMLQLAIIIVVGGIFAIAAIVYGIRYVGRAKVSNEITAISDLRTNTVNYGARVGVFTAANSSLVALVGQNFFPTNMVGGTLAAPTVTNQWGGGVTVAVGTLTTAGDSLTFTSNGIPNSACTELGTSLDTVAGTITINGTATKALGAVSSPTAVATACANNDANVMIYGLGK